MSQIFPLDVDAIAARAEAAPGGRWEAFPDSMWIDWHASGDEEHEPGDCTESGRWISVWEQPWHTQSQDPPPELWMFLAAARGDVLSLVSEVHRLRARLDAAARSDAAAGIRNQASSSRLGSCALRPGEEAPA